MSLFLLPEASTVRLQKRLCLCSIVLAMQQRLTMSHDLYTCLTTGGYGGRGDFAGPRPRGEPGYSGGRGGGRPNGAYRGGFEGGRGGGRGTNINVDDQSAFPTLG